MLTHDKTRITQCCVSKTERGLQGAGSERGAWAIPPPHPTPTLHSHTPLPPHPTPVQKDITGNLLDVGDRNWTLSADSFSDVTHIARCSSRTGSGHICYSREWSWGIAAWATRDSEQTTGTLGRPLPLQLSTLDSLGLLRLSVEERGARILCGRLVFL